MLIFFAFLIFGAVIGALFGNFTEGRGLNLGGNVIVGIIGAFASGLVAGATIDSEIGWYPIAVMLTSCVGALILLIVFYLIKK
jgi:uncharacterized membrane protein YeaQ/YmgE (transglycosylase-associated protein family)